MKRLISFSLANIILVAAFAQLTNKLTTPIPSVQGGNLSTAQLLGQLNTITTAVPFLLISPDSRAGGMGDAGVASSPDANSMHWNPSKYGLIEKKMGASISYVPGFVLWYPILTLLMFRFFTNPLKREHLPQV